MTCVISVIPRRFTGKRLVIATHNEGKRKELASLLKSLNLDMPSALELGLPVPEETGSSFEENALLKAHAAAQYSGFPALADDSGFCVDALGGAPGIETADWAGNPRDFGRAMARVEEELRKKGAFSPEQRKAHFVCVLALVWPDGISRIFRGEVTGRIISPIRGEQGFGYDACFLPEGSERSFGEMSFEEKHSWRPENPHNALSHRAKAFSLLWNHALIPAAGTRKYFDQTERT